MSSSSVAGMMVGPGKAGGVASAPAPGAAVYLLQRGWHLFSSPYVLMALVSCFVTGAWLPTKVQALAFIPLVFAFIGFGMSNILHRFFAHQAFHTSSFMACVLSVLGTLSNQGAPLWWAAIHRRHHKYCDQPEDPHSWTQTNYVYAWVGWSFYEYGTDWKYVPRLFRTNAALVVLHWAHPLLYCAFVWWLTRTAGAQSALWCYTLPSFAGLVITTKFNVDYHPKPGSHMHTETGTQTKSTVCKATDGSPSFGPGAARIVGEYYHDDHHLHPRKAHRPGLDLPYYLMLCPLAAVGMIRVDGAQGAKRA